MPDGASSLADLVARYQRFHEHCEASEGTEIDQLWEWADVLARALEFPEPPFDEQRFYVLTSDDVGRGRIRAWGTSWSVVRFMGAVHHNDVGKRVYRVPTENLGFDGKPRHILQVENDEQFQGRLNREG
jgi:hypothetical protein